MAIRQGLIGNPVIQGLLGGGGPAAIKAAKNRALFEAMPKGQAVRMSAPGAIVRPPDNSLGQGLSALGKALGDIGDMREQGAAKKDLADLYGQTKTVQEPGTGETASVPRTVTSGDIYKLMGKYIDNPTIQKSLGLQAQRLGLEEREQRDRQFTTGEREASQGFKRELEDERLNVKKLKIFSDLQKEILKNSGGNTKSTGKVMISNGKHLPIYRTGSGSNANDIVIVDGQKKSITEVEGQIRQLADLDPSTQTLKTTATADEKSDRAQNAVSTVESILKKVRGNIDKIGAVGSLKSGVNQARGIIGDLFGDSAIKTMADLAAGVVTGGPEEQKFLNALPSMSEKLAEEMIRIRTNAKGRAPNKEEIKAIRQLTNLTGFVSSGTLIASLERLETRLAEDAKIIAEKASKISGSSTASPESNQNNLGITVPPGFNIK